MSSRPRIDRYFLLAKGFTTSRTPSIMSRTTGVSVRFFNVMIPTGNGGIGRSTGRTVKRGRFEPNFNSENGSVPKHGPLASSAQKREAPPHTALLGGNVTPHARNASATSGPIIVSCRGRIQGSSLSSESSIFRRRAHLDFG